MPTEQHPPRTNREGGLIRPSAAPFAPQPLHALSISLTSPERRGSNDRDTMAGGQAAISSLSLLLRAAALSLHPRGASSSAAASATASASHLCTGATRAGSGADPMAMAHGYSGPMPGRRGGGPSLSYPRWAATGLSTDSLLSHARSSSTARFDFHLNFSPYRSSRPCSPVPSWGLHRVGELAPPSRTREWRQAWQHAMWRWPDYDQLPSSN
jgi:hypothetical protein